MKDHSKIHIGILALALILAIFLLIILPKVIAPHANIGTNYKNVTIWTRVNITHSRPDVLSVNISEALNASARNITVNAGGIKGVICNATLRDWQGFNDILSVNATLFHNATSSSGAPNNNNSHYTNSSCTLNQSIDAFVGWYVCSFDVVHYSNNGTWICNISVSTTWSMYNNSNLTGRGFGTTTFIPVYALNITDGIDYGGVSVEDYSLPDRTANITNLGNMRLNMTVEGYGSTKGDGLAMNCTLSGNITVDNEKFSATPATTYPLKTSLVGTPGGVMIPGLTIAKQNDSNMITNSTYWQLYVPPNPAGNCTGYIIFTAVAS